MAVHHLTVTLGAAATPLSAAANPSINAKEVQLESETGNADVKVGDRNVSATDYGRTLEAGPTKAIIMRPNGNTTVNLASTFLFGTASQKVHVLYIQ